MQNLRTRIKTWYFVRINVSVGEPIASAGGSVTGESTEQPRSRSWQRADRLWKNAVNTYIVNGYGSPHVKNYVDNVQGKPNEQRDRWIESMTTVIAGITEEVTPEDEAPDETPEADPTQPDAGVAGEIVAGLRRVIDAGVEGLKFESMQPQELGTIDGELDGTEEVRLLANKIAQITFTITQDSMVNLWVNQSDITSTELFVKDIDIRLTGGNDDVSVDYSSDKGGGAGESVSSVLPAGTYSLFITDNTDYSQQTLLSKEEVSQLLLNVGVGININPYTTQKIEGRISIPESGESMPVSMGVAEFEPREDGTWRRKESDEVSSLNPNKPVWVVVHGRGDSEQGNNINYLAQCLSLQGYQVVTLDWEDAADDNDLTIGALQGANWIPAVGKWGADQLKAMRFEGNNVIDGGHSWGSLVAYEIGKNYKYGEDGNGYGVQAIVAMDSPLDALPNNYPINEVVFNDVSNVSLALHSSAFGSQSRANTADFNFDIPGINEAYENTIFMTPDKKVILDNAQAYFNEHGYSVSYFANLVKGKGDTSLDVLDIERLINGQMLDIIVDPNGPEGVLPITLQENIGPEGNYWQAIPTSLLDKP